jgi:hypothetical protein
VPNSLAFEFYLMGLLIEHIMNKVNPKKLCHRPAPSLSRRTVALPRTSGSIIRSGWREAAAITLGWTGTGNFLYKRPSLGAQVAQLVEQRTENPCVGGSIPPLGTIGASVVGSASYVAALRRVEALDGFDEDIFFYKRLPAIAEFGAEFDG